MTEPATVPDPVTVPDPATVARILAERATALARPLQAEAAGEVVDLVALAVGPERYGLDAGHMVEVRPLAGLARVPGLPAVWAGILNVRGALCPVLDLRRYLSLPEPDSGPGQPKVALVAGSGLTVGLLVDEALGIVRVPVAQLAPPLTGAAGAGRAPVRGVTPDLVTVLDIDALLADSSLVVREGPT
jgi:purine-binding chemotaxis protein CheW